MRKDETARSLYFMAFTKRWEQEIIPTAHLFFYYYFFLDKPQYLVLSLGINTICSIFNLLVAL